MSPVMPDSMANGSAFAGGQPAHGLTGALASLVVQSSRAPANLDYYVRLAARREHGKIKAYLEREQAKAPHNLYWARLGLLHAGASQDFDWAFALAESLPAPLALLVKGQTAPGPGRRSDRSGRIHPAGRGMERPRPVPAHGPGLGSVR